MLSYFVQTRKDAARFVYALSNPTRVRL